MLKLSSSSEKMYVPVTAPAGIDLTAVPASVALRLESTGGEPAAGEYIAGTIVNLSADKTSGEVMVLLTAGLFPDGQYLVFARYVSAPEDIRQFAGRCRIGDVRI